MLVDRETESRLLNILRAVASSYTIYMIGRELGQSIPQAATSALGIATSGRLTFLESAYMAGKTATVLGTDRLRKMTEPELVDWLRDNNLRISSQDRVMINQLKDSTERWLQGRTSTWQAKMRQEIARADQQWRAAIASTRFNDAQAISVARNQALQNLVQRVEDNSADWVGDIDRLVQSEMNAYFQMGQAAEMPGDEMVYKIPRVTACEHCLRITTEPDGSPTLYRLSDVMGNSNIGLPAYAWEFTIGPIHPYCYCVLYQVSDREPTALEGLVEAKENLKKSLTRDNSCGIPRDPNLLFENQQQSPDTHSPRPAHVTALINAIRQTYGDTLPGD